MQCMLLLVPMQNLSLLTNWELVRYVMHPTCIEKFLSTSCKFLIEDDRISM